MTKDIEKLSKKELIILQKILEGHNTRESLRKATNLSTIEIEKNINFLVNKGFIERKDQEYTLVKATDKSKKYLDSPLPEEKLYEIIKKERTKPLPELRDLFELPQEFNKALGLLKRLGIISIDQGVVKFLKEDPDFEMEIQRKKELISKALEGFELKEKDKILEELLSRGLLTLEKRTKTELVPLIDNIDIKPEDFIEKYTRDVLSNKEWLNKKFRKYDVVSKVPKIRGGNFHHFKEFINHLKQIMISLGYREQEGDWVETGFWEFDVMFTPQDHPAREVHDTFYLKGHGQIEDQELLTKVKEEHEKFYKYDYSEEIAKKLVLRTHTTTVSFRRILKGVKAPERYFCIGRVFRNEAIDRTHLAEFYQLEGIIVDHEFSIKDLMSSIKDIFDAMGIKIRFRPHYFPYTEPSIEILTWFDELGEWVELGGAGIFREEALRPLNAQDYAIGAFGFGVERIAMSIYGIDDIRNVFGNYVTLDLIRNYKVKKW